MNREPFNEGWAVKQRSSMFETMAGGRGAISVTLPHDAMLAGGRSAESPGGSFSGYFDSGAWEYEKTFHATESWRGKRVTIEFEAVYRDARVFVNGAAAGQWANGYTGFYVELDRFLEYGQTNTIRVEAQANKDSRWYSGAGIFRPAHLLIGGLTHFTPTGLRVTTPTIDPEVAVVMVETDIVNEGYESKTYDLTLELQNGLGGIAARKTSRVTILAGDRLTSAERLYVRRPELWDVNNPTLYTARVVLTDGADGEIVDESTTVFGIRQVSLDPVRGLQINGVALKLRGACVHHDNGILGAATHAEAEERRVRVLKQAGFNAIRSAHNPMSKAMLDACDRQGMLVMDETFDNWGTGKMDDDYSRRFLDWWERDVDALVAKDFNHPSVIMYSIGNEIPEVGTKHGARWARLMAARIREQDPHRFITNAINGMSAARDLIPGVMASSDDATAKETHENAGFNDLLGNFTDLMDKVIALPEVAERLIEDASVLDVVGLNYGDALYDADRDRFPDRIVVGAETFPAHIDRYWNLVKQDPRILGDFTWTGWDYLGETGIGRPIYPGEGESLASPFPGLTAGVGDIDIIGQRRPISYYREIVFGLRKEPYLAIQRPEHHDTPFTPRAWSWSDSVSTWSWPVEPGTPITAEAYADADEVQFRVNGVLRATSPVGVDQAFIARAELEYEPGTIEAIALSGGAVIGRFELRSAGEAVQLVAEVEGTDATSASELTYVTVRLVDSVGTTVVFDDRFIETNVTGPGVLAGLGTARASTTESFLHNGCTSFEGCALVAVRRNGMPGQVSLTIRSRGLEDVIVQLPSHPRPAAMDVPAATSTHRARS